MNNADRLKIGSTVYSIRWDGAGCVRMGKATFVGKSIARKNVPTIQMSGCNVVDSLLPQKAFHQGSPLDPKLIADRIANRINLLNDGERWEDFAFLWHPTPYLAAYWFLNESFITPKPEEADVMRVITAATACVELLRVTGFLGTGETTAYPEPESDPDDDDDGCEDEEDEDDVEPNRRPGPWT